MLTVAGAPNGEYELVPDDDTKDGERLEEELGETELKSSASAAAERRLVRKLDKRLMSCLFLMIVLNYLDRNALANARVQGVEKTLGLAGSEFNTAISVFFIGYIGLQIPSNLLLTRVRPSLYLPGCMIAWGLLSGISGFVRGFKSLAAVRFLLGMVEAPFFPGALYLLSSWYTKRELGFRVAILYSGSLLSGAFGGLVAAGVQYDLNGVWHQPSWRWLFIIESLTTIILAMCAMFILPDYPQTTRWLTNAEKSLAMSRLERSSSINDTNSGHHFNLLSGLHAAVTDSKVWLLATIITAKTTAGTVTSFIPTLVATFGLSKIHTLLLVAPPYVFAAAVTLVISRSSDHRSERGLHIIIPILVASVAFILSALTLETILRYLSLFLMLGGVYGSFNVALAWISSTVPSPAEKRSASLAIVNSIGNLAQVFAPYLYLQEFGPKYLLAMVVNAGACFTCAMIALALRNLLKKENERMRRGEETDDHDDEGRKGEGFRYVL